MFPTRINKLACAVTFLGGTLLALFAAGAPARSAPRPNPQDIWSIAGTRPDRKIPTEVPGQAIVRLAAGADAAAVAGQLNLHIQSKLAFAPDTYLLSGIQGDLGPAIDQINQTPGVLSAGKNLIYRGASLPNVTPNDTLYGQQWQLRMLNAPSLWGITVGERLANGPAKNVVVGVIDSTFETAHPDLAENFAPGAFDFVRNVPYDPNLVTFNSFISHGTNVSGTIAAVTNNATGIAALPWEGVQILACHAGDNTSFFGSAPEPIMTGATVANAIYYCIQQQTDVINMSFGIQGTEQFLPGQQAIIDPLVAQAVQDAYANGIVLVGSSGNYRDAILGIGGINLQSPPVQFPANMAEVFSVGAVGPNGELAFYSNGGPELQFVAPGGNGSNLISVNGSNSEMIVTDALASIFFFSFQGSLPVGYAFSQGTSLAAGHVSGTVATLITQGARDETLTAVEQVERIRQILKKTAHNPFGLRTDDFGYGLIDPAAALREFSPAIDINSPAPNSDTASFSEPLDAVLQRPMLTPAATGVPGDYVRSLPVLTSDDFQVLVNGTDLTDEVTITDPNFGSISRVPTPITRYNTGVNTLNILAADTLRPDLQRSLEGPAVGHIPARAYRFRVSPKVIQAGVQMLSVPFALQDDGTENSPASLSFLFGGNLVRLARWVPEGLGADGHYAVFDISGSPQEPEADLTSPGRGVAQAPVGLGFFARVTNATQVQLLGSSEQAPLYKIDLNVGYNMIGDPYTFRVPWNVVNVQYGNEIISIQEAANRHLISNAIWRYQSNPDPDTVNGQTGYSFQTLPGGELIPWEGHWVQAFAPLTLLVPKVASQTQASAQARSLTKMAAGGWRSAVHATSKGSGATVYLGESRQAANGPDNQDLQFPPRIADGGIDLRVRHADWGGASGGYAQDIRREGTGSQTWDLELETSKAGIPVKLTWDQFPASRRISLTVDGKPQTRPLVRGGSLELTPKAAGVHHIKVVASAA